MLTSAGHAVVAIGKIQDLFAGRGITSAVHTRSDDHGVDEIEKAMATARTRPDLRQPRRLRHGVRPPQRSGRATRRTSSDSTRGSRAAAEAASARPARHHRRPRQRSDDAEHRSRARVRAAVRRRRARAAGRRPRHAATFADLGQTIADVFGVGAAGERDELPSESSVMHQPGRRMTWRTADS